MILIKIITYCKQLSISKRIQHGMHVTLASEVQSRSNMTMRRFYTLWVTMNKNTGILKQFKINRRLAIWLRLCVKTTLYAKIIKWKSVLPTTQGAFRATQTSFSSRVLIQKHKVTGNIESSKTKPKLITWANHILHRQSCGPIKIQNKYNVHAADAKRGKTILSRDKTAVSR